MLQIRQTQLDVFRPLMLRDFEERAISHFRRQLPEHVAQCSDDQLCARIRRFIDEAGRYGLHTEYNVLCFADASILLGDGFEQEGDHSWALGVLRNSKLSAQQRAELLLDTACELA